MKSPEKQFERAVAAYRSGKFIAAKKLITKLERDFGPHPQILHLKAFLEVELGKPESAVAALEAAAQHFPDDANLFNALAVSLRKIFRYQEAETAHQRAIELNPNDAAYYQNFGNLLSEIGDLAGAVNAYSNSLRLDTGLSEVAVSLATDLDRLGRKDEAVDVLETQINQDPENIELRLQLANIEHQAANLPAAFKWYASATEIEPKNASAVGGLMSIRVLQGDVGTAISSFKRWEEKNGRSHGLGGYYVHSLNYLPSATPSDLRNAAEAVGSNLKVLGAPPSIRKASRPIKVGIISRRFGMHPVNFFASPMMAATDPAECQFELFASHVAENAASKSIRGLAANWHDITHMPAEERVTFIRSRNLDIAITPTGHEETEILDLFRPRIAPIQLAAFAIFGTTGVKQVDGLITDNYQTPDGFEDGYTEQLIRMPNGYICFKPYDFMPSLDDGHADTSHTITFGSFNNLAKVCDATLTLWSSILDAVPNSRLLLKTHALGDQLTRDKFRARAQTAGIDMERLLLEGPSSHSDLLRSYLRVDIALDPLAYSGGLTTLEALWMGTPVVTLPGNTFARRHSLSHLSVAGLAEWVATSPESYVEIAARIADETNSRNDMRQWLRDKMTVSPTSDAKTYACDFINNIRHFMS